MGSPFGVEDLLFWGVRCGVATEGGATINVTTLEVGVNR